MGVWLTASQRKEFDLFSYEINVSPNQAMRPSTIDDERVAEQAHPTTGVRSTQVDDAAPGLSLEIEFPRAGKPRSARCRIDAQSSPLAVGHGIFSRLSLHSGKRVEMEALPDFSLPTSVKAFDRSLEPGFSWRSKDRGYSQAQAKSNDASDGIPKLVSALETGVVIKLGIGRQSERSPMFNQGLNHRMSEDGVIGPRGDQTSMHRYSVENFDPSSAFDDQALDNIEAIQLASSSCHLGQIPTAWRWRMTSSTSAVQNAAPLQDPSDGTQCGKRSHAASGQFSPNGLSSIFSQGAHILELGTHLENQIFNTPLGPPNVMRPVGSVTPIDSGQPLPLSSIDPIMHRGNAHAKASCYLTQRFSSPHSTYHRFTFCKLRTFLTMVDCLSRFTSTISNLFDIIWHLGVRHQVAAIPLIEGLAFTVSPANKAQVLKTLTRKLGVMDPAALEEGYQEILTGLDRRPYPSLEGMKNIQRLLQSREPRLANVKIENIVDDELMRKLDSSGFIDRVYRVYGIK